MCTWCWRRRRQLRVARGRSGPRPTAGAFGPQRSRARRHAATWPHIWRSIREQRWPMSPIRCRSVGAPSPIVRHCCRRDTRRGRGERLARRASSHGVARAASDAAALSSCFRARARNIRTWVATSTAGAGIPPSFRSLRRDPEARCSARICVTLLYPRGELAPRAPRSADCCHGIAQPAIFAVEYALAQTLDGLGRAARRHDRSQHRRIRRRDTRRRDVSGGRADRWWPNAGRLMQDAARRRHAGGAAAEPAICGAHARRRLAIAAVNGPALCVVAGPAWCRSTSLPSGLASARRDGAPPAHVARLPFADDGPDRRAARRASARRDRLSAAAAALCLVLSRATWIGRRRRRPRRTTGRGTPASRCVSRLRMASACRRALRPILLEVGPGNALSTLALQALRGRDSRTVITSLPDSARELPDRDACWRRSGRLWTGRALEPELARLHDGAAAAGAVAQLPLRAQATTGSSRDPRAICAVLGRSYRLATPPNGSRGHRTATPPPSPSGRRHDAESRRLSGAIAAILEELSGKRPPRHTSDTSFLEMGYDSLFLTQVAQKIQGQMKVKIDLPAAARRLLDHSGAGRLPGRHDCTRATTPGRASPASSQPPVAARPPPRAVHDLASDIASRYAAARRASGRSAAADSGGATSCRQPAPAISSELTVSATTPGPPAPSA